MRKILNFMVLAVLLPALLTATVLTYLHFFAPGTRISGKWTASLDMTDQAAVTAIGWLQDIEGIDIEGDFGFYAGDGEHGTGFHR